MFKFGVEDWMKRSPVCRCLMLDRIKVNSWGWGTCGCEQGYELRQWESTRSIAQLCQPQQAVLLCVMGRAAGISWSLWAPSSSVYSTKRRCLPMAWKIILGTALLRVTLPTTKHWSCCSVIQEVLSVYLFFPRVPVLIVYEKFYKCNHRKKSCSVTKFWQCKAMDILQLTLSVPFNF